uniref:Uncharacterized protein n=1 Tax=Arundo donax TaxID=35708 RepID=A0A0A8Z7R7_ARUDO
MVPAFNLGRGEVTNIFPFL